jgi:hypothetical protein
MSYFIKIDLLNGSGLDFFIICFYKIYLTMEGDLITKQHGYAAQKGRIVVATASVACGLILFGAINLRSSTDEYIKKYQAYEKTHSREIGIYRIEGYDFILPWDVRKKTSECTDIGKDIEKFRIGDDDEIIMARCSTPELIRKDTESP